MTEHTSQLHEVYNQLKPCPKCRESKRTTFHVDLEDHLARCHHSPNPSHTPTPRPNNCRVCPKVFELNTWFKSVTINGLDGVEPYNCIECGQTFKWDDIPILDVEAAIKAGYVTSTGARGPRSSSRTEPVNGEATGSGTRSGITTRNGAAAGKKVVKLTRKRRAASRVRPEKSAANNRMIKIVNCGSDRVEFKAVGSSDSNISSSESDDDGGDDDEAETDLEPEPEPEVEEEFESVPKAKKPRIQRARKEKPERRKRPEKLREKKFVCEQCGSRFRTKSDLNRHVEKVHVDPSPDFYRPFDCDVCSKKFTSAMSLKRHVLFCHGTKEEVNRYGCEFCDAKFSTPVALETHTNKIHTNLKPFR